MGNIKGIKIYIPSLELSEKVYNVLMAKGATARTKPKEESHNYMLVDTLGEIVYLSNKKLWEASCLPEVSYKSILNPFYDVKIAWANGKTVQRKVNSSGEWIWADWKRELYIDFSIGLDWRIKPKIITVHQWEQKYYDPVHELVRTVAYDKEAPYSVPIMWTPIGEPYKIEHTFSLE